MWPRYQVSVYRTIGPLVGIFAVPAFATGIYQLDNTCPNPAYLSYLFLSNATLVGFYRAHLLSTKKINDQN